MSDGRASTPCRGFYLSQRRKIRRRLRPALSDLAFVGIAPCRLRRDPRLGERRIASRHSQRRDAVERDVRSQAGAAVETVEIRQLHRRGRARAVRHAAVDKLATPLILSYGLRNSRGRRAILPPRSRLPASRSSFWSGKPPTTISKCWRRSLILTACSAARCLGKWVWRDGGSAAI